MGVIKRPNEDAASIAKGIAGKKGNVHVSFGTPIEGDFNDADEVAAAIDRQVIENYVLHPTNFFAYKLLNGDYPAGVYSAQHLPFKSGQLVNEERAFNTRIDALPAAHRKYALGIYANAIDSKRLFSSAD